MIMVLTHFTRLCLVFAALVLVTSCNDGHEASSDNPTTKEHYTFSGQTVAISYALMGVAADGTAAAGVDAAAMLTPSGQVRLIFTGPNGAMRSATSVDGVTFTVDTGFTSPFSAAGVGQQTVVTSPSGGYRMFARQGTQIFSATSVDGATWTQESGVRFDVSSMGLTSTTGPSVVALAAGGYRMYFSPEPTNCGQAGVSNSVYSASSPDQLTWSADTGVRVGDKVDARCKNKPAALAEPDGSITLFYHVYSRIGGGDSYEGMIFYSNSADGMTFTTQTSTGVGATSPTSGGLTLASDPAILRMPDQSLRLYFDVLHAPDGDQVYVASGSVN